jgi:hypothetical protein
MAAFLVVPAENPNSGAKAHLARGDQTAWSDRLAILVSQLECGEVQLGGFVGRRKEMAPAVHGR